MGIVTHVYYLPFYFQCSMGTSASESGDRLLAYLMVLLFTPMITGSLVTLMGHYVPFMLVGCALFTIGAGFLTTLEPDSRPAAWIGFQVLAALGAGMCRQMAFTAVPLVLRPEDLPTGTALVAFCNSVGSALALGIGQAIFNQSLSRELRENLPGTDVHAISRAGAAEVFRLVPAAELAALKLAFNVAVSRTFILAIASGGLAFCTSVTMDWINVKKHGGH
jgi:MFS family permease